MNRTLSRGALIAGAVLVSATVLSSCMHRDGPGYGPGNGMGWGPGPGAMMGGWGPGMMMGGWGYGWSGLEGLDLTAEQREQIARIHDEMRQQHWALMRSMHDEGGMHGGRWWRDSAGERQSFERQQAIHRQMFDLHQAARQRILQVLTPQQRERLDQAPPRR